MVNNAAEEHVRHQDRRAQSLTTITVMGEKNKKINKENTNHNQWQL